MHNDKQSYKMNHNERYSTAQSDCSFYKNYVFRNLFLFEKKLTNKQHGRELRPIDRWNDAIYFISEKINDGYSILLSMTTWYKDLKKAHYIFFDTGRVFNALIVCLW